MRHEAPVPALACDGYAASTQFRPTKPLWAHPAPVGFVAHACRARVWPQLSAPPKTRLVAAPKTNLADACFVQSSFATLFASLTCVA